MIHALHHSLAARLIYVNNKCLRSGKHTIRKGRSLGWLRIGRSYQRSAL